MLYSAVSLSRRSKFNKKEQIEKLRVSAFHRLKIRRLKTSPSIVMAISKLYKQSIQLYKCHEINKIIYYPAFTVLGVQQGGIFRQFVNFERLENFFNLPNAKL